LRSGGASMRLAIFITHPVQYHVPIWRGLNDRLCGKIGVFYFSDHSVRGAVDKDFGVGVAWDSGLLNGYRHEFVRRDANVHRTWSIPLGRGREVLATEDLEAVMIHGYTHLFELEILACAKRLGLRVIMRGEFYDKRPGRRYITAVAREMFLRYAYARVDAFCYVGRAAETHLRARGISAGRMYFSPYSIDTDLFEAQVSTVDRTATRKQLGIVDDSVAIVYSGKLIPRKNPHLLVSAIEAMRDRSRVSLIIVGDGPLRDEVIRYARHVLGDRLHFQGFQNQSQIGRSLAAADIFVLPSRYETWGLVVNEAMQFGLPVVVTDAVGCHQDLVVDQSTGVVVPADDVAALSKALQRLVDDRALRQAVGRNARRHIAKYSTAASVDGIIASLAALKP